MQRFGQIASVSTMSFLIYFFLGLTVMLPTLAVYSFYNNGILFGKVNDLSIYSSIIIGLFAAVKYGTETWHKTKKKKFWKND